MVAHASTDKLEKDIEAPSRKWLEEQGLLVLKLNVMGQRGWPDILIVGTSKVIFIEFKRPSKKPEPRLLQRIIHKSLKRLKQRVYVFTTIEEVKKTIKKEFPTHFKKSRT